MVHWYIIFLCKFSCEINIINPNQQVVAKNSFLGWYCYAKLEYHNDCGDHSGHPSLWVPEAIVTALLELCT